MHAKTVKEQRKELLEALKGHNEWRYQSPCGAPPQAWHLYTQELVTYSIGGRRWSSHRGHYDTAQQAIKDIEEAFTRTKHP